MKTKSWGNKTHSWQHRRFRKYQPKEILCLNIGNSYCNIFSPPKKLLIDGGLKMKKIPFSIILLVYFSYIIA